MRIQRTWGIIMPPTFQGVNDLQRLDPFSIKIRPRQESRISSVKDRTFPDISSLYFYCRFTFPCEGRDTLHTSRDPESILLKFFFVGVYQYYTLMLKLQIVAMIVKQICSSRKRIQNFKVNV